MFDTAAAPAEGASFADALGWRAPLSEPDAPREVALAPVRGSVLELQRWAVAVLADERDDPAATAEVSVLARIGTQVELALVERIGDVDRSGAWALDGSASLAGWVEAETRLTRLQVGGQLKLARSLRDKQPTRAHVADGVIRIDHARHICRGIDRLAEVLPDEAGAEDEAALAGEAGPAGEAGHAREAGPAGEAAPEPVTPAEILRALEQALLDAAEHVDAVRLGTEVRKHTAALAPLPASRDEAGLHARRSLSRTKDGDGSWHGRFSLGTEDGALLDAAIQAYRRTDHSSGDRRTPAQRDADALMGLVRAGVEAGALPLQHRVRPHLLVTVPLQTWLAHRNDAGKGCSTATLLDGEPLSAGTLGRLACDARVTRIVLDPAGLPLDVGRTQRTVPPQVYLAAAARDRGCAARGCRQPLERCEAHHLRPFSLGGDTSLANTAMLCTGRAGHHATIHDRNRSIRLKDGRWVGPRGVLRAPPGSRTDDPSPDPP